MADIDLPVDLETVTVAELARHLDAGTFTSVDLVEASLASIEALDRRGPSLHAVGAVVPGAREQAARADADRRRGKQGTLVGIPVLVKDNIDVAGMATTAGSLALEGSTPAGDAPIVTALRRAGAVILGKANLTEFANFMATDMPSGYSSLAGQVLNPYDVSVTPSGSSSGSAAAVATGLSALAVGTETSGSILAPAEAQSVVGIKPTAGLVSRTGIVPISHTQDTAGPIARTVADAAALLDAMVDAGSSTSAALSPGALAGARLGVVTSFDGKLSPDQIALWEDARRALADRGATLVPVELPAPEGEWTVLTFEFRDDLDSYLRNLPDGAPMRSLAEVVAFNRAHAGAMLKYGQARLLDSLAVDTAAGSRDRARYEAARASDLAETKERIDAAMATADLGALVYPEVEGYDTGARAGYPSVTVPAGYRESNRRPFGVQFLGRAFAETVLIAYAYDFEQATLLRRPPSEVNPSLFRSALPAPPR
ncbi:MAG TPA: amidase family protein [Acidimicrobiales bacterium]|nr:amidase family protein [Acidimicrobiales bacterium]